MSDVTIIGAGPAGCTAAILLARAGRDVTLVEQHRFPRDKVCGECLSALGVEVLERLGLAESIAALEPVRLSRAELVSPDGAAAVLDLPRPMWGLSRCALDGALLDAARAAGAAVRQPARCEGVDPAGPSVTLRDLVTNRVETIASTDVLIADGKAGCGPAPSPPPTGDLGMKGHFTGVESPHDTIGLFGLHGHYVGVAPIEGGRWNVAMSVPAARVRAFGGDLDALFEQCLRENRELAKRFRRARRAGEWLASPLPRHGVAPSWPAGVVPIGNAAAALEPIGGEGMGLAVRSAELAAEWLVARGRPKGAAATSRDARTLAQAFDRLWNRRSLACRGIALLLSRPARAGVVVELARCSDTLARLAMRGMGKV